MIENSNFRAGLKRAAGDGNAVTIMKANGLMRTAGKRFLQVMAVGSGPLSNRKDMSVSDKVGFSPIQVAPQRLLGLCPVLTGDKGVFCFRRKLL